METIEETVEAREYLFGIRLQMKDGSILQDQRKQKTNDPEQARRAIFIAYKKCAHTGL